MLVFFLMSYSLAVTPQHYTIAYPGSELCGLF